MMRLRAIPALGLLLLWTTAAAEPYLAVYKGMQCSSCHSNPSGGGKRVVYGNVFAQTELAAQRLGDPATSLWTGEVLSWLSVGADLRGGYESIDVPAAGSDSDFEIRRGTVYVEASLVPNRLSIYVDEKVAPDDVDYRELYLKLKTRDNRFFVTAGQFLLPYGLRLEDDSAFIRLATGVNFNLPDRGVQFGYESGPWSAQLSLTNGTGTGPVVDSIDRVSFVAHYVQPRWRAGVSFSATDSAAGDRQMQNAFFGVRTGPVVWLGELDFISDDVPGAASVDAVAGLIEGNWLYRKGHNLKISYEYLDPNDGVSEDHQVRWSALWEYTPMQFLQTRLGARFYDGIPQASFQNRDEFFAELHIFF
ncbi:MAG: hypothetical protein L0Y45_02220 [Woeseiaceae bacterium]|nr:hypothetical protein [Woeseiaceae bacterium]